MKQPASRRHASIVISVFLLTLLAVPIAAQQAEEAGAKSLFYDPAAKRFWPPGMKPTPAPAPPVRKPPATALKSRVRPVMPVPVEAVKFPGIHYWVELKGKGSVTEEQTFYTGDQIQLHVRSNVDGYLTLWALGAGEQRQQLFPPPGQSQIDNFVKAGVEYMPQGFIEFRPPAEDERLLIFFSRSKTEAPTPAPGGAPAGGKALVFEVEKKDSQTSGSYLINREGGSVQREIRLKHQPRKESQE